jgi:hypothetical protein
MTRRTVAALQADLHTGLISGSQNHGFVTDLTDSYLDLDTYEAYKAAVLAGTGGIRIGMEQTLWSKTSLDMNVTTDQAFTKAGTFTNFLITAIRFVNASANLTTAAGGIYNTASKGGTALVANTQVYSALTAATIGVDLTLASIAKGLRSDAALYLSLTTGQGSAATADAYIIGVPLS